MGFLSNLSAKNLKNLNTYCENEPSASDQIPFTLDYTQTDPCVETIDRLLGVNKFVHEWRYEYYDKFLNVHNRLIKAAGAEMFQAYIENAVTDQFRDESDRWIKVTKFNLFAEHERGLEPKTPPERERGPEREPEQESEMKPKPKAAPKTKRDTK
jgi:hypothetical protein